MEIQKHKNCIVFISSFIVFLLFVTGRWGLLVVHRNQIIPKSSLGGSSFRAEHQTEMKTKAHFNGFNRYFFFLESRIRLNKPIFLSSIINNNNLRMGIPYGFASFPVPITIKELLILPFFGILTYFW